MNLQVELNIQKGIREVENELVEKMEDAFAGKDIKKLEESQFRNLLQVALSTESPEVVKNFLRYQVGRDDKWGKGKDSLAEAIIKDIQDIQGSLKQRAEAIAQTAGAPERANTIHMDLIRRYLGYGSRHLTWLRKGNSNPKNSDAKKPV